VFSLHYHQFYRIGDMSQIENYTGTWIETPLSKFGFKCVMNKHDFCVNSLCECLCHHVNDSN